MFQTNYDAKVLSELDKCLRVMPHHQNTSGFFITVIEKLEEMDGDEPVLETEDKSKNTPKEVIQKDTGAKEENFYRCQLTDPDCEYIQSQYGLEKGEFPTEQLVTQSTDMKRVIFISKELSRFLQADEDKHELKIINLGCTVFQRNNSKKSSNMECIYRVSQDGLRFLMPWLKRRIVYTKDFDSFKRCIMYRYHALGLEGETNQIPEETFRKEMVDFTPGCFIIIF